MDAAEKPRAYPKEWEDKVRGILPAFIFYERDYTGEKVGFCSRCGHRFLGAMKRTESPDDPDIRFRDRGHNERLTCPGCGGDWLLKSLARFGNMRSLAGKTRAVFAEAITPVHVRLRAFYIEYRYVRRGIGPVMEFHEDFFMDLTPGNVETWRKVPYTRDNWQRVGIIEPWNIRDSFNPYIDKSYTFFWSGLAGTFLGYLPIRDMGRWDWSHTTGYGNWCDIIPWCKVLAWAAIFPSVEMVAKLGGRGLIFDLVFKKKRNARYVDWTARRLGDFLKIPREYARAVAKDGFDPDVLAMIHDLKIDFETAARFRDAGWTGWDATSIGIEGMKYLEKQKLGANWSHVLRDYWKAAAYLGRDMKVPTIKYPKNLRDAHDKATASANALRREREQQSREKAVSEYAVRLYPVYRERYEYQNGEFTVIVPERLDDIRIEGENQKHCVAGYIDRHAAGKLAIVFIRRTLAPMVPVWTVEMHGAQMRQIQGYHNETQNQPKDAAKAWVENWLRVVEQRIKKEKRSRKHG